MGDVARLEDELAIARIVEEYEALRPLVEDPATRTPELMAEYHEKNQAIADARQAFKRKYSRDEPVEGDAEATPETLAGGTALNQPD